jgi:hypothetical protein
MDGSLAGTHSLVMINTSGNDANVSLASSANFAFAGAFTIEFLTAVLEVGTKHGFMGTWSVSPGSCSFAISWDSGILSARIMVGSTPYVVSGPLTLAQGQPYAIRFERDGSNVLRLYVNGVMIGKTTGASGTLNQAAIQIGRVIDPNDTGFYRYSRGRFDEIRITRNVARCGSDSGYQHFIHAKHPRSA